MRFLIDGYNLLHAIGLLVGRVGPHGLQKARLALLGRLLALHRAEVAAVTVVFDASGAPPGAAPEEDYQGIRLLYALDGVADDLIEEHIQGEANPEHLTVVSDDHRIQQAGRRRRCLVLGCMEYLDWMERDRRARPTAPEAPVKPDGLTPDETKHWLREFADLVNDPGVREALGPDFGEER
jgi:predicted RNA-binding protein with PIN domain